MRNKTRTQSLFMFFGGERRVGVRLRRARGLMGKDEGRCSRAVFRGQCVLTPYKETIVFYGEKTYFQFPLGSKNGGIKTNLAVSSMTVYKS